MTPPASAHYSYVRKFSVRKRMILILPLIRVLYNVRTGTVALAVKQKLYRSACSTVNIAPSRYEIRSVIAINEVKTVAPVSRRHCAEKIKNRLRGMHTE